MHINLIFLSLVFFQATSISAAESDGKKGLRIIQQGEQFHANFKDYQADGRMVLQDASGSQSERKLTLKVMEDKEDGDDFIMIFATPKDVKGTALLVDAHTDDDDERWLYLPAVKRIKRIAASLKSGPFLGSEFSYQDLTPRVIEKYTYKYLKTTSCGKRSCDLVESLDIDKKARYRRQILYISKKNFLVIRIDYFDRKNKLAKVLKAYGYKKHQGQHWAASKVVMNNKINGKKTIFFYKNYQFGNGFSKADFSQNALKRIR